MDHIEPAAAGADRGPWPNSEFQETGASMARLIPKTPEDRLWPWRSRPGAPAAVCQRFRPTASLSPQVATPLPLPRGLSCDSLGPYLTGHCCELSLGPYLTGHCRELNLGPYLTGHCSELSYIPQIDVSEPQHPRIWLYVKTRLLKRWLSYNEVLRVGPDPDDWGPYGKRLGRRHTQSDVRRQREDGCLHAKERGLRRNQPCRHRDLRPLV